jgi:hypothetical protein
MTEWELQDFAVQIVRDHLEKQGRKLMSWQGNRSVDPSIWFVDDRGSEWVVVRVGYPQKSVVPPTNWRAIAERCSRLGNQAALPRYPLRTRTMRPPLCRRCRYGAGIALLASFDGLVAGPVG